MLNTLNPPRKHSKTITSPRRARARPTLPRAPEPVTADDIDKWLEDEARLLRSMHEEREEAKRIRLFTYGLLAVTLVGLILAIY